MKLPLDDMRRTYPESVRKTATQTTKSGKVQVCVASPVPYGLTLCGEDEHADPAQPGDTINCPDCIKIIQLCKKVR